MASLLRTAWLHEQQVQLPELLVHGDWKNRLDKEEGRLLNSGQKQTLASNEFWSIQGVSLFFP